MADRRGRYERRQEAARRRAQESRRARRANWRRKLMTGATVLAGAAVVVAALVLYGSIQKTLPPTTFGPAHSEAFPPQRIMEEPIPLPVQEHVMEHGHGPGGNYPGILVQYNCQEYQCKDNLVANLEDIVQRYPTYAYLAPFPGMDAKIALAAPGNLDILDDFDEQKIIQFIRDNQGP